ncbi:MAG: arsenosugar biosynthesis radical SAM (seleno)protein ArsS [Gammaproteobacteria bacterium]
MATNFSTETQGLTSFPAVKRNELRALQINLGYRCNQACQHCHVDAGPNRTEMMSAETCEFIFDFAQQRKIKLVDLTGGAPELNPNFRGLVARLREQNIDVIDRCNLTILEEPGQEDLAEFLARKRVKIVASMPCHGETLVDLQRGKGVFEKSIRALQRLNALGYALPGSELEIDLVHNPVGPSLPPAQGPLENAYKEELFQNYQIRFNRLLTITNMPIARFKHALIRDGAYHDYMATLVNSFQAANLDNLMCKSLLSVDWRGYVYDCDFNQMLGMPLGSARNDTHLRDLISRDLTATDVHVASHCFGCTAGQGSSCGGALNE